MDVALTFDRKLGLYGVCAVIGEKYKPLAHADTTDNNMSRPASADVIDRPAVCCLIK